MSFIRIAAAMLACTPALVLAGIFPPVAGDANSTAIPAGDNAFEAWATGHKDYQPGIEADAEFRTPAKSLGEPGNSNGNNEGTIFDIVSLGRGGQITITFSRPIYDGPGFDFAVFENSFDDTFLEFAKVEVSSDGQNFAAFPALSQVPAPIGAFGSVDTTDVDQVAGKYRGGYGTPFDLARLPDTTGVDINDIRYIRLVDVVGDGSASNEFTPANFAAYLGVTEAELPGSLVAIANNAPAVIYDVYPTVSSAGFDLDAIGVLNANPIPVDLDVDTFDPNNEIDPDSTGNIPITVFTTRIADGDAVDFDAADISTVSLRLGSGEATVISGPFTTDVDADGDADYSYFFQTQDTGIACEDTEMQLVGATQDAQPLAGVDFVVTPDCPSGCHP